MKDTELAASSRSIDTGRQIWDAHSNDNMFPVDSFTERRVEEEKSHACRHAESSSEKSDSASGRFWMRRPFFRSKLGDVSSLGRLMEGGTLRSQSDVVEPSCNVLWEDTERVDDSDAIVCIIIICTRCCLRFDSWTAGPSGGFVL